MVKAPAARATSAPPANNRKRADVRDGRGGFPGEATRRVRRAGSVIVSALGKAASVGVRVLIVSWEFPPVVVGGLGRHVAELADALHAGGTEVVVLTRGTAAVMSEVTHHGVRVVRCAVDEVAVDFTTES